MGNRRPKAYRYPFYKLYFLPRGTASILIVIFSQYWRDLMFVLVSVGTLFVFEYVNLAFVPLFALPLNRTPKDRQPFIFPIPNNTVYRMPAWLLYAGTCSFL